MSQENVDAVRTVIEHFNAGDRTVPQELLAPDFELETPFSSVSGTLRHALASLMNDHGYTASQIASQLGHADGGVLAMRTYIHAEMIDAPAFIDGSFAQDGP